MPDDNLNLDNDTNKEIRNQVSQTHGDEIIDVIGKIIL